MLMLHTTFLVLFLLDCSYSNKKNNNNTCICVLLKKKRLKLVPPVLILGFGPVYQIHTAAQTTVSMCVSHTWAVKESVNICQAFFKSSFLAGVKRRFFRCSVRCRDGGRQPDIICAHCLCIKSLPPFSSAI